MLTKLRKSVKTVTSRVALSFIKVGLSANMLTFLGLVFALIYFIAILELRNPYLGVLLIALSAFMDGIDGEVARLSGTAGPKGAFIDSSLDRIEDVLYISGFLFFGINPILIALLVGFSLIISYIRAKGELLGLKMEGVGIIERGERILFVIASLILIRIFSLGSFILLSLLLLLSVVTVVQRFVYVYTHLR
ncbi:MAG: archaetidylinositol phosphate synthase [Sulfolobaceae archaeon]|nr:archaetidylinositol phosphate synthase [Sulfolobaceae archaeon]